MNPTQNNLKDYDLRLAAFLEKDYPVIENISSKLKAAIARATEAGKQYVPDVRQAKTVESVLPVVKEFQMTCDAAENNVHTRMLNQKGALDRRLDATRPKPDAMTAAVMELTSVLKRRDLRSDLEQIPHEERSRLFFQARDRGDLEFLSAYDGLRPLMPPQVIENAKKEIEYTSKLQAAPQELENFETALQARDSFKVTIEIAKRQAEKLLADAGITGSDLGEAKQMTTEEKAEFLSTYGLEAWQKKVNPLA